MRIGVIRLSVQGTDSSTEYNSQFIGLSKQLDTYFDEVKVYQCVYRQVASYSVVHVEGTIHTTLTTLPVGSIGVNGLIDVKCLDKSLDAIILFADIQLMVPTVVRWAKRNSIKLYPYIGVMESHSEKALFKRIMNILANRNFRLYKKLKCFAKTPSVEQALHARAIQDVTLLPAGLDTSLLHIYFETTKSFDCRNEFQLPANERCILFVGRLAEEKHPMEMIAIFEKLLEKRNDIHLIMIGNGVLQDQVLTTIHEHNITDKVSYFSEIKNSDMWKIYRAANVFVNLNEHEIFGMAILESMFYKLPVVANDAPGPSYIINNEINGYIVHDTQTMIKKIEWVLDGEKPQLGLAAHRRIVEKFTWKAIAENAFRLIQSSR